MGRERVPSRRAGIWKSPSAVCLQLVSRLVQQTKCSRSEMTATTEGIYHQRSNSIAKVVLFSVVSVYGCVCVCLHVNTTTLEPFEIAYYPTILWEQHVVRNSAESKNGCILLHCGAWVGDLSLTFYSGSN